MQRQGIDLLLVASPANHFWLTGYDGWSFYTPQMVLLHMDEDEPIWFGRKMDSVWARFTAFMGEERIVPYPDEYVASRERHPMQYLAKIVRERGWGSARVGAEMDDYYYTARWHQILTAELPDARFQDAFLLVNWCRLKKSEREIAYLMPAPRERHAALQSARPVSSIPPRLGENHPVSTAPLASRSRLLPRGCDAWPPRYSGLVEQNFSPSVGRRFPPVEGVAMPFLPLRLAPLVLAVSVALSGTATASVLVTVNKATQRMTVLVDGETRYSWPVSTGMKGYATPAGTFRPFRLEEEHYSKEWDDAPMTHSIFFTPAGHAIHGSNATRRLGSPASHGC